MFNLTKPFLVLLCLWCFPVMAVEWKYVHPRIINNITNDNFTPPNHYSWDPESLFTAAAAYSKAGNVTRALDFAKESFKVGVPIERYYAGPRSFLGNLVNSQAFKNWAAPYNIKLLHGPMLGLVSDTSAGVWVRTISAMPVQLLAVEKGGQDTLVSDIVQTDPQKDFTVIAQVFKLKPNTEYNYFVKIDGELISGSRNFKTFPYEGQRTKFTIGFSGGAAFAPHDAFNQGNGKVGNLNKNLERMWDTIATHDMLAFFLLGDNVYIDHPANQDVQDYCYYARQSRPEFKNFVSSMSILSIWDDHDFGKNDGIGGLDLNTPSWKMDVLETYKNNWINPAYGIGSSEPGVFFKQSIDRVDFFMIDGRFYRTPTSNTILGPAQMQWLKSELTKSKAYFKVIASPVPWAYDTKPGSKDTWDGYNDERKEIFDFIRDNQIDGVFFISADRHRGDHWKLPHPNNYDYHEFSFSKLTNDHTHPVLNSNPYLVSGVNQKQFFAQLTFDLEPSDPTVDLNVQNIDNESVYKFSFKRSDLMNNPGPVEVIADSKLSEHSVFFNPPNFKPVKINFKAACAAKNCGSMKFRLFDTQGNSVDYKDSDINSGFYFLKILGDEVNITRKIILVQ